MSRTAVKGIIPMDKTFASLSFHDTDTANKTTNLTFQSVSISLPESNDYMPDFASPFAMYDYKVKSFTREFGNVYKFVITDSENAVLLTHGQHAYFILFGLEQGPDRYTQPFILFDLEKKPTGNSINFTDKPGSVWHSEYASGTIIYPDGSRMINEPIIINSIELRFPEESFDIQNKSIGMKIIVDWLQLSDGTFSSPYTLNTDRELVNVKNVGYNTFYAVTNANGNESFMITFIDDDTAIVIGLINNDGVFISSVQTMRRTR